MYTEIDLFPTLPTLNLLFCKNEIGRFPFYTSLGFFLFRQARETKIGPTKKKDSDHLFEKEKERKGMREEGMEQKLLALNPEDADREDGGDGHNS
jgi:hypothetical protein